MQFKCIKCGNVEDSEKECKCSKCGSTMYPMPYNTKEKQIELMKKMVLDLLTINPGRDYYSFASIKVNQIKKNEIDSYNVLMHNETILSYVIPQKFINSSRTSEEYCKKLGEYVNNLKLCYVSDYSFNYKTTLNHVISLVRNVDYKIGEISRVFDANYEIDDVEFDELYVNYKKHIDQTNLKNFLSLLDKLEMLADKIRKTIRLNNIYGLAFKTSYKRDYATKENKTYLDDIDLFHKNLDMILEKKVDIDFFEDNAEASVEEMLFVYWSTIDYALNIPVYANDYNFNYKNELYNENTFDVFVNSVIKDHYRNIYDAIENGIFFSNRSDEEINTIFNELVDNNNKYFLINKFSQFLSVGENEKKLNGLIGLSNVKENIKKIKAYALKNKDDKSLNLHMCFFGNPGTGKTEVARIIAGILHENGILKTNKVIETDRSGLVGEYVGETAQKTLRKIEMAMGGVLFVDEAYSLAENGNIDYGKEAISTLIKAMEDYRGQFCVILAGYKNEMEKMISTNPGFRSRIQFNLEFENYSRNELGEIANKMVADRSYKFGNGTLERILDITEIKRKERDFANAREIRNILDQTIMCQNIRCLETDSKDILVCDVDKYIEELKIRIPNQLSNKKILSGLEELNTLIGLDSVKKVVRKINAYAQRNITNEDFNMHMCFFGNPGTGKTEVARIISRILHDSGVLSEAKLIETDSSGLIGRYVGETAQKTKKIINDSLNGVLFIDEAYALKTNNSISNYGDEAISVLLKEMEDKRGKFCVILAGYEEPTKEMLATNPGFESRIQFNLYFPDYSNDELKQIAELFITKKKYKIDEDALIRIVSIAESYRSKPNFSNARTVRRIIDQVIMNQNLRSEPGDKLIILDDVVEYEMEVGLQ